MGVRSALVALALLVAACGEGRSYQVVPTSAAEGGVVLAIAKPVSDQGDFSYSIRNESSQCIAMTLVDLPRDGDLFLDGVIELVDESGRTLNRHILGYPDESVRGTIRLEPNEQLTEDVYLRHIFDVPDLEGHVASFTLEYRLCDARSPADMRSLRLENIRFARAD